MDIHNKLVMELEKSLKNLDRRNRNSLWIVELLTPDPDGVKRADYMKLITMAIMPIIQGIQQKSTLVDISCAIGRKIRHKFRYKPDSLASLSAGLLILECFAQPSVDFLYIKRSFGRGKKRQKHPMYRIFVRDWDNYNRFMEEVDIDKLEESPLKAPATDWETGFHVDTGNSLIRHGDVKTLKQMDKTKYPLIFGALNKLQKTGYTINKNVYRVYLECLKLPSGSPFKYERETNNEARKSMEIEAQAVKELANSNLNNSFYHRYSCDFRGRIYPGTAYLHEQSSDNAKGLLMYDHEVAFGEDGAWYLAVHTANCLGEDKIPLDARVQFVNDNMDKLRDWSEDPMEHRGWMTTDKPWSALACAFEWARYNHWISQGNNKEDFMSSLPIFIDGSNNGVQHLTALALDEISAPLVNLDVTKEDTVPGDIYMFIADKCWEAVEKIDKDIPDENKVHIERLCAEVKEIKLEYEKAGGKKARDEAYKKLVEWRTQNRELAKELWTTFWLRIEKRSIRRKCVKRPVMTLGYGVTLSGVREMLFDDTKELSDELRYKEKMWVTPMGDLVYNTCYSELKGPATMLTLFRRLAEEANGRNEFLRWSVPVTEFPVVQAYEEPKKVQVNAIFLKERLQLTVQKYEDMKLSRRDQLSGAAPNVVHSFDAGHLTMVVNRANFPVTMVHDSFGCHIGNMPKMFEIVRQQFVEFYKTDPLAALLTELNAKELMPTRGTLNIYDIMQSDFAFC